VDEVREINEKEEFNDAVSVEVLMELMLSMFLPLLGMSLVLPAFFMFLTIFSISPIAVKLQNMIRVAFVGLILVVVVVIMWFRFTMNIYNRHYTKVTMKEYFIILKRYLLSISPKVQFFEVDHPDLDCCLDLGETHSAYDLIKVRQLLERLV
jgi:hypothetical protein